jgi:hypothetical protein
MTKLMTALALAVSLTACSTDDDLSPREECELYVDTVCNATVECVADTSFAQCQDELDFQFDCANQVTYASSSFYICIDDINFGSCGDLFVPDGPNLEFFPPDTCVDY